MENDFQQQVLALSLWVDALNAVSIIARRGHDPDDRINQLLPIIYQTNPDNLQNVLGNDFDWLRSLRNLVDLFGRDGEPEIIRYAIQTLHLERKLHKQPKVTSNLRREIKDLADKLSFITKENQIFTMASWYQEHISPLGSKIKVSGTPSYLQQQEIAANIRALLFCSIRAIVLWRMFGGNRWSLLFGRKGICDTALQLQREL